VHDEKLVLHSRKGLVVHDLLEETLLGLRVRTQEGGYPSFERLGVESVRKEMCLFHWLIACTSKDVVGCRSCVEMTVSRFGSSMRIQVSCP
jgi:hypothetical protein